MTDKSTPLLEQRERFIMDLKRGKMRGTSFDIAAATVVYLRKFVAQSKFSDLESIINDVRQEGKMLVSGDKTEFVVFNMVLRVLKLIREEKQRLLTEGSEEAPSDPYDSLHKLWDTRPLTAKEVSPRELRQSIVDILGEFLQEMENSRENIAVQAPDHIQDRDVILTFGDSLTVVAFLKKAAEAKRRFEVVVGENAPSYSGNRLVDRLKSGGVRATVVSDADLFGGRASTADKVVLGARAILADGGFVAPAGALSLCLAAKRNALPVIVCAAFYKLTPKFLSSDDQESFNLLAAPGSIIPYCDGHLVGRAEIYNPLFDYVPPDLVSLYIMQTSGHAPSYIYRLLGEYFDPDDIEYSG